MVDAQTFPDTHLESEAYGIKVDIQSVMQLESEAYGSKSESSHFDNYKLDQYLGILIAYGIVEMEPCLVRVMADIDWHLPPILNHSLYTSFGPIIISLPPWELFCLHTHYPWVPNPSPSVYISDISWSFQCQFLMP